MGNPLPVNLAAECRKADKILKDFVDPVNGLDRVIPLTVLRRAKGFAIFSIFRVGFVLTARAGSGVVIAKLPDGSWSAPSALGIGGIGGGFSAGAEVTDFIVVLNSRSAVKSFMATGSLQLGGNLSLAVGPLGRSAEASGALNSSGGVAAMFSYSKSQGLFGGVSLEGTALVDRSDANSKAYNRSITAKKILSGAVDVPAFAQGLIGTIERLSLTGRMSEASRADEIEPGAGRESWDLDDDREDDDDLYARPRRDKSAREGDGLESYFSQAELDSRQRRYERDQANGTAYTRPAPPSTSSSARRSPSPSFTRPPLSSATGGSSATRMSRDPFATSDDEPDPYSLDRDNATRNAGAYSFSSHGGGSVTNSPSASRGDAAVTTPSGSSRKRADSKASFKGAAAGYFDEYLGSKDKRAYSPIDGKRPTVGHRKASSSFSIPKLGRKTPPAFGRPNESLIPATGPTFNEEFHDEDANKFGFSSGDTMGGSAHEWQREASPTPANSMGEPPFGASDYGEKTTAHRPPSSRKGSSSLFSFGGGSSAAAAPSYGVNGGLKKTTAADAIRAAAAAGGTSGASRSGKSGATSDAFSDIWDAERARASTQVNSYTNGLDSLDEELQRGNSLRRGANNAGPSSSTTRGSTVPRSYSNSGGAGYTSFSDDRPASGGPSDRHTTSTTRFSPISFFRTNSGGVKSSNSNTGAATGRTGSGGGFRSGSGGGFRTSSRNSNSNSKSTLPGAGGLSNFVGIGMGRSGSNSGFTSSNGRGSAAAAAARDSHLLGSSSEGEEDRDDLYALHPDHHRELNGSDEIGQIFAPKTAPVNDHTADDWGMADLSVHDNKTTTTTEHVVASFDFAGQEADDLRFNRGDVITVLKKTDSTNDWWLGKTADGRVGSFPANFVEGV